MISFDRDQLREWGMHRVTGEACALSMRILYELNQEAWEAWCDFTGMPQAANYPRQGLTNGYSSLLIPHEYEAKFLIYLCFVHGYSYVIQIPYQSGNSYGISERFLAFENKELELFQSKRDDIARRGWQYQSFVLYQQPGQNTDANHGFRNFHNFSGSFG